MARYLLFWFVLMVIGILNGVLRVATYANWMPELAAHQVSTGTAILFLGAAAWLYFRKRPLSSSKQAWQVGALWFVLTVAFEFGFGHYVAGHSWQRLFADYNILQGRVWPLALLWILVMPVIIHRMQKVRT